MKTVEKEYCETCGGEGELAVQEEVYPNEANSVTAFLGKTYPCPDCNN